MYIKTSLIKLLKIQENDVLSVWGSGGKTSLIFKISDETKDKKVLISTTTKMFLPDKSQYDFIKTGYEEVKKSVSNQENGRYFLCSRHIEENKVEGFNASFLDELVDHFNVSLIESDGSRQKPLKAWGVSEPVIINKTTKSVLVISLKHLFKPCKESYIHRYEIFKEITNKKDEEILDFEDIRTLLLLKKDVLCQKNATKILFINQIDNDFEKQNCIDFLNYFKEIEIFDTVILSSIKKGVYELWK